MKNKAVVKMPDRRIETVGIAPHVKEILGMALGEDVRFRRAC